MKIKFLVDFRGRETGERYYRAGETVELEDETAQTLVSDGRAELVVKSPISKPKSKPKGKP